MQSSLLLLLLLVLFVVATLCSGEKSSNSTASYFTVYYDPIARNYLVEKGKDIVSGVAVAEYSDERSSTGWARFNSESNPVYDDSIQAYGTGFLEGFITADLIWAYWANFAKNKGPLPQSLLSFFKQNLAWVEAQVALYSSHDVYWGHVALVMQQLYGMHAGYNAKVAADRSANKSALALIDFVVLNSRGDLDTLDTMFNFTYEVDRGTAFGGTHCSSLIKVTPDNSELFAGHTTWTSFWTMTRIFKSYKLPFSAPSTNAVRTMYSGYPGILSSIDDFYQLSSNLVVVETTNSVFNTALYKLVVPSSILSWTRVIVANRMATGGKSWVDIFSKYNSGTYTNQWIIVDYSLFTPGAPLRDNLLWIAEQIPGYIESADVTSYLRMGFWQSYNIPFFSKIFVDSGYLPAVQKYGDWMTYDMNPRAAIFRRDANKVYTMSDYKKFMRYNDWQHDPLAAGNPGNQISSRFDLVPRNATITNPYLVRAPFGGTDSKVTSSTMVKAGVCQAQSGPTHDNLAPFDWTVGGWGVAHAGQPDLWNFGWVEFPNGVSVL